MNISILVFGGDHFLATLPDRLRDASTFSVEAIANVNQAVSRIQIKPPDVIVVQASLDGSMELCRWLKEQTKLSWIYCILVEDTPELLAFKSQFGREWELEMTCAALRQGADAYIWQQPKQKTDNPPAEETANEQLLLAHLSVGLRKAQKYRDLVRTNDLLTAISLADSLTELKNRRALDGDLPRHIQKARSSETPLSLIILDVDYFKKVNDSYGHLVGDRLLQLLSHRLRHNLRFGDTPFRYGGEEFVIVLTNTTCDEALLVARRLNRVVSEQPFAINNKLAINVTISVGTACLQPEDDTKGTSLLERADQFLLQAKAAGRNRVIGCSRNMFRKASHLQAVS
ncbi:diguanylate cyclase [Scytonema sp. HK-05]|uniref:GGDEF domain-containing protein n=1 Tax=Scytonema sp. HK-05 TaxID=1137095 RepID=UPI0009364C2D|nr:GGDEF domain-containing protein [Scytonema sp. HK-05]OKH48297.1 GGDEF domain-containing protein [Scytonema sp. HK-05]BAY47757.1 diguanylate cyclase [Scytonema sp. HK-05]